MEEKYIDIEIKDLLEVELENDDDFLKVKETLTRIGVSSRKDKKLYQSIRLKSTHIKRQRSLTRFSAEFYEIFMKNPKINKKMKSLNITATKISSKIIQGKIEPEHYGLEDDIETRNTMKEVFSNTARWPSGFGGFTADVFANINGEEQKGTVTV